MAAFLARAFVFFLWLGAVAAQEPEKYPFRLDTQKDKNGVTFWARNDGVSPVSVILRLGNMENLRSDEPLPVLAVIPPNSSKKVLRVERLEPGPWRYQSKWGWRAGDYRSKHDPNARYRVPWADGTTRVIGQAPGGRITTHDNAWSRDAVDVGMPQGTPVLAARGGLVVRAFGEFSEGGLEPRYKNKANTVRVLHDDGTMGEYVHFMHKGVAVKVGERVEAGRILGFSGSTGYSRGPHLHFAVLRLQRTEDQLEYVSEPFSFYIGNPAHVFSPRSGQMVPADYAAPGSEPKMRAIRGQALN
jgi:murein DD-endopeptidase MepM/ murein hydrolase activator NlpD